MQQRKIDIKQVLNAVIKGKPQNNNNRIIYTYNNVCVILNIEKTHVITVHYESRINRIIKKLAKQYKVNFTQAITIYKQQTA